MNSKAPIYESPFSQFVRNATDEQKTDVYRKVLEKVAESQNAILRRASEKAMCESK